MPEKISMEEATKIVKSYFDTVKGKLMIGQMPLIDLLGFNIISVEQVNGFYEVKCEFNDNMFSDKRRLKYAVKLYKESGEITEVRRDDE